jgi:high mobility group protein B2
VFSFSVEQCEYVGIDLLRVLSVLQKVLVGDYAENNIIQVLPIEHMMGLRVVAVGPLFRLSSRLPSHTHRGIINRSKPSTWLMFIQVSPTFDIFFAPRSSRSRFQFFMEQQEEPPSPLEDDLGVDDFDLKQDHLLGPSPVPPPLPDDEDDDDDHDDHDLNDEEDIGGAAAVALTSPGSFRMKKGDSNSSADEHDRNHDHVVMLDEERDDHQMDPLTMTSGLAGQGNAGQDLTQSPDASTQPRSRASSTATSTPSPKRKRREKSSLRKHPGAPKRFKSSYICFFTAKQPEIKERLGSTATVGQISRESAQMWKNLTAEEKAHWDDVAAKDKQRYMEEKATYTGPWQVPYKRQKKDKGSPKRPMSAFLHFSQSRRQEIKDKHPNIKNTEISRVLGEIWRNSSDEEKRPFIEQEKVEREKYKKAMAVWKDESENRKEKERMQQEEEMKHRQEELKKQGERIMAYQQSYKHHARPPPNYNAYAQHSMAAPAWGSSKAETGAAAGAGGPPPSSLKQWQSMSPEERKRYEPYMNRPQYYGGPGYPPFFYPLPAGFSSMMYRKSFSCNDKVSTDVSDVAEFDPLLITYIDPFLLPVL